MHGFQVEKHILRFYKYKFYGFDKPVVIEAYNKLEARQKLQYFFEKHPEYATVQIISESLSLPIFGETTKTINNIEHVWVGNLTPSCWMPLEEYKQTHYDS